MSDTGSTFGSDTEYDICNLCRAEPCVCGIRTSQAVTPTEMRFWKSTKRTEACWLWTATLDHNGYGRFWNGERYVPAHRWSYERLVGPIPVGLQIDHLCRTRACVNPAHLEPVTQRENMLRGVGACSRNAVKTHCPQGHALTPDNLDRSHMLKCGRRKCRACRNALARRSRAEKTAARRASTPEPR